MEWEKKCMIGVPFLDAQHKSLFSAIERIRDILQENDDDRNRRLCKEALKFLESHTSRHFEDEEDYMRSIHYPQYEQHRAQHQAIRETLVSLKDDLIVSNYAPHSVKNMIGTMIAWLSYHTIELDSAICTGALHHIDCSNSAAVAMENAATRIVSEVFQDSLELINESYEGIPNGNFIFFSTDCSHPDGREFRIMGALGDQVVLHSINTLFSTQQTYIDETALSATKELSALLSIHFLQNYQNGDFFHVDSTELLDESRFLTLQPSTRSLCSLLFGSVYGGFLLRAWTV